MHRSYQSIERLLRQVFTYNAQDWGEGNNATQGGYSDSYVIDHRCEAVLGTANQCRHLPGCDGHHALGALFASFFLWTSQPLTVCTMRLCHLHK